MKLQIMKQRSWILAGVGMLVAALAATTSQASFSKKSKNKYKPPSSLNAPNSVGGKETPSSNLDEIYYSGTSKTILGQAWMDPGLYQLAHEDRRTKYWLIVEPYVNDSSRFLAILIPTEKQVINGGAQRRGYLMQGRPQADGRTMITPLVIKNGLLTTLSTSTENAPVFYLSVKDGRFHWPYVLQPENGMMSNQLLYAKKSRFFEFANPRLREDVKRGVMHGRENFSFDLLRKITDLGYTDIISENGERLIINAGLLTLGNTVEGYTSFRMLPINGTGSGRIVGLTRGTNNTITESLEGKAPLERLALLIDRSICEEDFMVVMRPSGKKDGEMELSIFAEEPSRISDKVLPGKFYRPDSAGQ